MRVEPTTAEREWTFEDRSDWHSGPWNTKPDKVEFSAHGFVCIARRNRNGAWCGYVGVPPGHPWYEGQPCYSQDHNEILPYPDVHGGLTYAAKAQEPWEGRPQEHVTALAGVNDDDRWYVGFDCGHLHDSTPVEPPLETLGQTYRDLPYVRREIRDLARQASAACDTEVSA